MNILKAGMVCVAAVGLLVSSAIQAENKKIDVSVVQQGEEFKLDFLNSECPSHPNQKGCILGNHGASHKLRWEFDRDARRQWKFTRLRFSNDGETWGVEPLNDCIMEAFELEPASRQSGWANTARVTGNGREIRIDNGNQDVCELHYMLFAEPAAGGDEINSDPRIDNRGGGPQA